MTRWIEFKSNWYEWEDGNLWENELGKIPSLGCAVCWYGDWGFYLTLLYFSMVVPYAYLGFKATNKSKGKFAVVKWNYFQFCLFQRRKSGFRYRITSRHTCLNRNILLKYFPVYYTKMARETPEVHSDKREEKVVPDPSVSSESSGSTGLLLNHCIDQIIHNWLGNYIFRHKCFNFYEREEVMCRS